MALLSFDMSTLLLEKLPTKRDPHGGSQSKLIDSRALANILLSYGGKIDKVFIERQWGRPNGSKKNTCKLCRNYGDVMSTFDVLGYNITCEFTPVQWQNRVFTEEQLQIKGKGRSIELAQKLFPNIDFPMLGSEVDDNACEAILIAVAGIRWLEEND